MKKKLICAFAFSMLLTGCARQTFTYKLSNSSYSTDVSFTLNDNIQIEKMNISFVETSDTSERTFYCIPNKKYFDVNIRFESNKTIEKIDFYRSENKWPMPDAYGSKLVFDVDNNHYEYDVRFYFAGFCDDSLDLTINNLKKNNDNIRLDYFNVKFKLNN